MSMNGVHIEHQKLLSFEHGADFLLIDSGMKTRDIAQDEAVLQELDLDPRQLISGQCSGPLLLSALGLLAVMPTSTVTKRQAAEVGMPVLERPFHAAGSLATAGGCLTSQFLAGGAIIQSAGWRYAGKVLRHVSPVGQTDEYVAPCYGGDRSY